MSIEAVATMAALVFILAVTALAGTTACRCRGELPGATVVLNNGR